MAQISTHMSDYAPPLKVKYTQLLINGKFVDSISGKTFPTVDPRNGEVITYVSEAGPDDVDIAVKAARKAFNEGPWPRMSGYSRNVILLKWAELLEKHSDELAALETWDNGKPLMVSKHMDVPSSIKYLRSIAGWGDKISGNTFRLDVHIMPSLCVIGAIIPWNFPLFMFMLKTVPVLVAGNTIVLKPAEQTPLTALFAAAMAIEAGVPSGVLNVVPGFGATAGAAISSHMDIDKVTFTGSTGVGRQIMEAAARSNLKAVTLELGGKSPVVICDDADVDVAVDLAHLSLFFNMGQCCVAGSRVFVQEGIYEKFLSKVAEKTAKQVVGNPFKTDVGQGPQINESQLKRILSYIESGKEEGATLLTGGNRIGNKGYFVEPTVFADVKDDMKIAKEEIFGPVMTILKFKTLDEVIERANNTCYGLAAGIVTKDMNVANRLSRSIRAGTVWINCYHIVDPVMPFGGYKMSGIGRESGLHGILHYVQARAVVTPVQESPWL